MDAPLEIKVRIYRDAVRLFEEGKIYPTVTRMLKFRYEEHDGELIGNLVEKARNREWEGLKKQADQLEKQGLDFETIKTELQHLETDAEVFDYIISDWYDIKNMYQSYLHQNSEEGRGLSRKHLIYSLIATVITGALAYIIYTNNPPRVWRIIIFSSLGLFFINLVVVAVYRIRKHYKQKNAG